MRLVVAAVALPALFFAQLHWGLSTTDLRRQGSIEVSTALTVLLWAIAALQGLSLFEIAREIRRRRPAWGEIALLALCALAMIVLAFRTPVTTSADYLAYLAYAKLPHFAQAYAPPRLAFPGPLAPINAAWGNPIVPCVYGPLWLALDRLFLGGAQTPAAAMETLRAVNLVAYLLLLGGLFAGAFNLEIVALVALNPALIFSFILGAHNDILALLLVVFALAAATRRWWPAAALLVAGAGLIKVTFLALGLLALRGGTRRMRLLCPAGSIALGLAGSLAFGGPHYLRAMTGVGQGGVSYIAHHRLPLLEYSAHALTALAGLAAIVATLWFDAPPLRSATWTYWTLGAAWFEWYFSWCVPYALRAGEYAVVFLALWPLAAAVLFHQLPHVNPVYAVILYLAWEVFATSRLRRAGSPSGATPLRFPSG